MAAAALVVDAHLHVWASADEAATDYPYEKGREPPEALKADTAHLIRLMDATSVDKAVIVQPINHLYDHSYVREAVRAHPTRFVGMALANPTLSPGAARQELTRLVRQEGFRGARFNPYLWPTNEEGLASMNDETGRALFEVCGELGVPVGFMVFQGLLHRLGGEPAPTHLEDISALMEQFPNTTVVLDHFAFTHKRTQPEAWAGLLDLCANNDNVYVKLSAPFRVSKEGAPPYSDLYPAQVFDLLRVCGPDRLMIGSDFPFVQDESGGYKTHMSSALLKDLSDADKARIMGGTAQQLFFG